MAFPAVPLGSTSPPIGVIDAAAPHVVLPLSITLSVDWLLCILSIVVLQENFYLAEHVSVGVPDVCDLREISLDRIPPLPGS